MDWAEARAAVARRYVVVTNRADELAIGRSPGERVIVRRRDALGIESVHVLASVRPALHMPLEAAMRLNAELPFGALAVDGLHLVFCQSLYLAVLEHASLHRVIRAVGKKARELRARPGLQRPECSYVDLFPI